MKATEFLGREESQSTNWIWSGTQGGDTWDRVETEGGFPRCHKGRRSKGRVVDTEVGWQSPAVSSFRVLPVSGQPHLVTEQDLGWKGLAGSANLIFSGGAHHSYLRSAGLPLPCPARFLPLLSGWLLINILHFGFYLSIYLSMLLENPISDRGVETSLLKSLLGRRKGSLNFFFFVFRAGRRRGLRGCAWRYWKGTGWLIDKAWGEERRWMLRSSLIGLEKEGYFAHSEIEAEGILIWWI